MWDLSKLAVLIGLLFLSGLFWWLPTALVTPAINISGLYQNIPDYYINHFKVIEMDTSGHPKYVLRAEQMVHYPHAKRTKLIAPRLTEYGPDGITHSRARTGWISRNGKRLLMQGDVNVVRSQGKNFVGANIVTQQINIRLR